MSIALGQIVRAVNKDNIPLTIGYASVSYTLYPDKDTFIPVEAAMVWFGDPRSGERVRSLKGEDGGVQFIADRATEVRRLRIKYGNGMGDETKFSNVPNVELYTPEGERITTVLDDPAGETVMAAKSSIAEQQSVQDLLRQQQDQIDALQKLIHQQRIDESDIAPEVDDEDVLMEPIEVSHRMATSGELPPDDDGA